MAQRDNTSDGIVKSNTEYAARAEAERLKLFLRNGKTYTWDYEYKTDSLTVGGGEANDTIKDTTTGFSDFMENVAHSYPESVDILRAVVDDRGRSGPTGKVEYQAGAAHGKIHWFRLRYSYIADESGEVTRIVGLVDDIQDEKDYSELKVRLKKPDLKREEFDSQLIADIFAFMNGVDDTDSAIDMILEVLGKYFRASRVYIFESSPDGKRTSNTYEWCDEGIKHEKANLQNLPYEGIFGQHYNLNFDQNGLFLCESVDSLPDDQREFLADQGIRSMLQKAIITNGRIEGFIGLDDCDHNRKWSEKQIGTMSIIAGLVGTFIHKKHEREGIQLSNDFIAAFDESTSYIYVVDVGTHEIIYSNKAVRKHFGSPMLGDTCFGIIAGMKSPCKACPVNDLIRTGKSVPTEIRRSDGTWLLVQTSVVHWNGKQSYLLNCTDITAQKKAEEQLIIAAAENEIVIRQSGKYLLHYDLKDGTATDMIDAFKLLNLPETVPDFENRVIDSGIVVEGSVNVFKTAFRNLRNGKTEINCDLRLRRADGSAGWFHVDSSTVSVDGIGDHALISFYDITEQRVREAHKAIESELEQVVQNIPGAVFSGMLHDGLSLDYVSEATCRMLGYTADELLSLNSEEALAMTDMRDRAEYKKLLKRLAAKPSVATLEHRLVCKDGSVIWVSETMKSVRRANGDMWAYSAVTEIGRERAVIDKLETLTDSIPGGIIAYECDKDGVRVTFFNNEVCRITGYTREECEALGNFDLWSLVYEDDREKSEKTFEKLISGKIRQADFEGRLLSKTGIVWVHIRAQSAEMGNGRVLVYSVLVDITARKTAEMQLEFRTKCLDIMDTTMSSVTYICILSRTRQIKFVSRNIGQVTGYTGEEFIAMSETGFKEILYPDDRERVVLASAGYYHRQPLNYEISFRVVCKDESVIWILQRATFIEDFEGSPAYLYVCSDITSQKEAEQEIRVNEEAYRTAIIKSNSIVYRLDIGSMTITLTDEAARAAGEKTYIMSVPESIIESGAIANEFIDEYREYYRAVASGEEGRAIEFRRRMADGEFHWMHGEYSLIRAADGRPTSAIMYFHNIDDEKYKDTEMAFVRRDRDTMITAAKQLFPFCIIANLTKNTYKFIEYVRSPMKKQPPEGEFDNLIEQG